MAKVFCQKWTESERGWGERSDGVTLHLTQTDVADYIKTYWAGMPKEVPHEYSKPEGLPKIVDLDKRTKLYKDLIKSKCGIAYYGELV